MEKINHVVTLSGYQAKATSLNLGTWGGVGAEQITVVCEGRWAELTVTATFVLGKIQSNKILVPSGGGVIDVPSIAVSKATSNAVRGRIVFEGTQGGSTIYSADCGYRVLERTDIDSNPATPDPGATAWQSYIQQTNNARVLAEAAALTAESKATLAGASATAAETAKESAVSAKNDAETAKNAAVSAKDAAVSAKNSAETAKSGAETAKAAADTSATQASNYAADALAKSQTATAQAELAGTSATDAASSARQAATSADRADAAVDEIHSMTATASTLAAGSSATASYDSTNNRLVFGIPKGDKGDKGDPGAKGDKGDPGQASVVDQSLTISGTAADAKAVGDALNQQKTNLVPSDYGVVGDGVADDTSALKLLFAAAMASNKTISFPERAKYRVTGNVCSNITKSIDFNGATFIIDYAYAGNTYAAFIASPTTEDSPHMGASHYWLQTNGIGFAGMAGEGVLENTNGVCAYGQAELGNGKEWGLGKRGSIDQVGYWEQMFVIDEEGVVQNGEPTCDGCYYKIRNVHIIRSNIEIKNINFEYLDTYHTCGVGLYITRSNTTVKNVRIYGSLMKEAYSGYGGFVIGADKCTQITFENVQGYNPIHTGQSGYILNISCDGLVLKDCRLFSLGDDTWGTIGGGYMSNVRVENCILSRFDTHYQATGLFTFVNSTIPFVTFPTGNAQYQFDNCKLAKITRRNDYLPPFTGKMIFRGGEITLPIDIRSRVPVEEELAYLETTSWEKSSWSDWCFYDVKFLNHKTLASHILNGGAPSISDDTMEPFVLNYRVDLRNCTWSVGSKYYLDDGEVGGYCKIFCNNGHGDVEIRAYGCTFASSNATDAMHNNYPWFGSGYDIKSAIFTNCKLTPTVNDWCTAGARVEKYFGCELAKPIRCNNNVKLLIMNSCTVEGTESIVEDGANAVVLATGNYSLGNALDAPCEDITIVGDVSSMGVGESITLTTMVTPSFCTDAISWSSDNPAVATVNNGTITGISLGSANITVVCGDCSDTYSVTVVAKTYSNVIKSDVSISSGQVGFNKTKTTTAIYTDPVFQHLGAGDSINIVITDPKITYYIKAFSLVGATQNASYISCVTKVDDDYNLNVDAYNAISYNYPRPFENATLIEQTAVTDSNYTYTATQDCYVTLSISYNKTTITDAGLSAIVAGMSITVNRN